jgi:hypothetical protein
MAPVSNRMARRLAALFFATTLMMAGAFVWLWLRVERLAKSMEPPPPALVKMEARSEPVSPLLLSYSLDLPGRGELFPALVAAGAQDYWPVATLRVQNTADRPVMQTITAEIRGWTQRSMQTVVLGPRESRTLHLNPELLPNAFANDEIRKATLRVTATLADSGITAFAQSRPVLLHGGSDLYWGKKFANAQFISRWVTPHSPAVMQLISDARKHVRNGRLPGYVGSRLSAKQMGAQVEMQARAAHKALQQSGISYISSIFTFGEFIGQAQRIRLPSETLSLRAANCIDVSVAFAAAMENLGLRPVIVIVPGHAFAGVRLGPETDQTLYVDLTVLPKGSFEQAVTRANNWLKKTPQERVLTVDVAAARVLGIYPLPTITDGKSEAIARDGRASAPIR